MGTKCARCSGLIVWDFDEALGRMNPRCVCCAFRPLDPPPRDPEPHGLCKPKVGNLTTCTCGQPKMEWRSFCRKCSMKKLNQKQRYLLRLKEEARARGNALPSTKKSWLKRLQEWQRPDATAALRECRKAASE